MRLEEATDVFCRSFAFTRSFTHPFEFIRMGGLRIMRDAVPKRDPRTQEIIVCGVNPEDALSQIEAYRPPRHFLCVIVGAMEGNASFESAKAAYKAGGYRMQGSEGFFVRDLSHRIDPRAIEVRRVTTLTEAEKVAKTAGSKQILPEHLEWGMVRLYAFWEGDEPAGWVRSIHLEQDSTWASNLFVRSDFRRRGIGRALMARMLEDDARAGARQSVLLASRAGAALYPQLGYERIGTLLLFSKKR